MGLKTKDRYDLILNLTKTRLDSCARISSLCIFTAWSLLALLAEVDVVVGIGAVIVVMVVVVLGVVLFVDGIDAALYDWKEGSI